MKRLTSLVFFLLTLLTVAAQSTNNQYHGTFFGNFYNINGSQFTGNGVTATTATNISTAAAQAVVANGLQSG